MPFNEEVCAIFRDNYFYALQYLPQRLYMFYHKGANISIQILDIEKPYEHSTSTIQQEVTDELKLEDIEHNWETVGKPLQSYYEGSVVKTVALQKQMLGKTEDVLIQFSGYILLKKDQKVRRFHQAMTLTCPEGRYWIQTDIMSIFGHDGTEPDIVIPDSPINQDEVLNTLVQWKQLNKTYPSMNSKELKIQIPTSSQWHNLYQYGQQLQSHYMQSQQPPPTQQKPGMPINYNQGYSMMRPVQMAYYQGAQTMMPPNGQMSYPQNVPPHPGMDAYYQFAPPPQQPAPHAQQPIQQVQGQAPQMTGTVPKQNVSYTQQQIVMGQQPIPQGQNIQLQGAYPNKTLNQGQAQMLPQHQVQQGQKNVPNFTVQNYAGIPSAPSIEQQANTKNINHTLVPEQNNQIKQDQTQQSGAQTKIARDLSHKEISQMLYQQNQAIPAKTQTIRQQSGPLKQQQRTEVVPQTDQVSNQQMNQQILNKNTASQQQQWPINNFKLDSKQVERVQNEPIKPTVQHSLVQQAPASANTQKQVQSTGVPSAQVIPQDSSGQLLSRGPVSQPEAPNKQHPTQQEVQTQVSVPKPVDVDHGSTPRSSPRREFIASTSKVTQEMLDEQCDIEEQIQQNNINKYFSQPSPKPATSSSQNVDQGTFPTNNGNVHVHRREDQAMDRIPSLTNKKPANAKQQPPQVEVNKIQGAPEAAQQLAFVQAQNGAQSNQPRISKPIEIQKQQKPEQAKTILNKQPAPPIQNQSAITAQVQTTPPKITQVTPPVQSQVETQNPSQHSNGRVNQQNRVTANPKNTNQQPSKQFSAQQQLLNQQYQLANKFINSRPSSGPTSQNVGSISTTPQGQIDVQGTQVNGNLSPSRVNGAQGRSQGNVQQPAQNGSLSYAQKVKQGPTGTAMAQSPSTPRTPVPSLQQIQQEQKNESIQNSPTRSSRNSPPRKNRGQPPASYLQSCSILVKGYPSNMSKEALLKLFGKFGTIKGDKFNPRPNGVGAIENHCYIDFDTPEAAQQASQEPIKIQGLTLDVTQKRPRQQFGGNRRSGQYQRGRQGDRNRYQGQKS